MILAAVRPQYVLTIGLMHAVLLALMRVGRTEQWWSASSQSEAMLRTGGSVLAHLITLMLCWIVAREYKEWSSLRWAWYLLSGDAFMSSVRYVLEGPWLKSILSGGVRILWSTHLISAGLICLMAGLLVTAYGIQRLRIGLRPRFGDTIAMGAVLASLPPVLYLRFGTLAAWTSAHTTVSFIFLATAIGIMVGSFCGQMGGGRLSLVLRVVVGYLLLRCVLNLLVGLEETHQIRLSTLFLFLQTLLPWMLTLAAALRTDVIRHAEEQIELHLMTPSAAGSV